MKKQVEAALAEKHAELEMLTNLKAEKERAFEDLNLSIEQFRQRYSSEVGQKQAELNRLNAELEKLIARKTPNIFNVNPKSSGIEPQVECSAEQNEAASIEPEVVPSHKISDLKEVKKVYRKIASVIHPDKCTDSRARALRTKLMVELNDAYAQKDTVAMQRILEKWEETPEAVAGESTDAELVRIHRSIEQMKKRIMEIEKEISRIRTSEIYRLMVKVQKEDRVGRDSFTEISMSIDAKIQDVKNRLFFKMYA